MLSRLTGAYQSEKASQEQVSDKTAAGVTALAKLVQIVGKDCGTQVTAVAAGYRPLAFSFTVGLLALPDFCLLCVHNKGQPPHGYILIVAGACAGSQEFGCSFR